MKNYQKFALAMIKNFKECDVINYREIIDVVQKEFPEVNKSSILPADYCDNNIGMDPHVGRYHIFHKLKISGQYKILNHSKIRKSCRLL